MTGECKDPGVSIYRYLTFLMKKLVTTRAQRPSFGKTVAGVTASNRLGAEIDSSR